MLEGVPSAAALLDGKCVVGVDLGRRDLVT
jgi:hypothetical protein